MLGLACLRFTEGKLPKQDIHKKEPFMIHHIQERIIHHSSQIMTIHRLMSHKCFGLDTTFVFSDNSRKAAVNQGNYANSVTSVCRLFSLLGLQLVFAMQHC